MKKILLLFIVFYCGTILTAFAPMPEEGMFPLSDLSKIDLNKAGLKIAQKDIYNPQGISLTDALVNIGGCTGSFVSEDGLIITNHHCVFDAVANASTPEKDYLTNGFKADERNMEIEAKGLTVRITESYEDVSAKILAFVAKTEDPAERLKIIQEKSLLLAREEEAKSPGIRAEVSEMFIGKTYVLFRYRTIQDVRLVYVPQRSIGEFGGETDNWVWPRHTGDFAFARAYVAPNGNSTPFSKANVPYKPKKHLKINANGAKEEDFVFMLGYPGITYRNRPAAYIAYEENHRLPYISELYDHQNKQMEIVGKTSKNVEILLSTRIKRNANVLKNFRGKLKGLNAINLVNQKQKEEQELQNFIKANNGLNAKYGCLLTEINEIYASIYVDAPRDLWMGEIYRNSTLLSIANAVNVYLIGLENSTDKEAFTRTNGKLFYERNIEPLYKNLILDADKRLLAKMLTDATLLDKVNKIDAVEYLYAGKKGSAEGYINGFVQNELKNSVLINQKVVEDFFLQNNTNTSLFNFDQVLNFSKKINDQLTAIKPTKDTRDGRLNKLLGDYVTVKELFKKSSFIPDANRTLRLTYGYVRGYEPVDGLYSKPFTGIKGIIEKGRLNNPDYIYPKTIKELYERGDFGKFAKKEMMDVPVCLLYNLDTTGGNSGSPIMNANGELIGVNFDRAYEATINDYAWNESYSRSIGVDIRYILWVAKKVDKADFILRELGVK